MSKLEKDGIMGYRSQVGRLWHGATLGWFYPLVATPRWRFLFPAPGRYGTGQSIPGKFRSLLLRAFGAGL